MANVREYACGCMIHDVVGAIRFCAGLKSKSLSGRAVASPEGAEAEHTRAMTKEPIRFYEVGDFRP